MNKYIIKEKCACKIVKYCNKNCQEHYKSLHVSKYSEMGDKNYFIKRKLNLHRILTMVTFDDSLLLSPIQVGLNLLESRRRGNEFVIGRLLEAAYVSLGFWLLSINISYLL